MPNLFEQLFGVGNQDPVGWENADNTEGMPIIEQKEVNGYHRAFRTFGGKREWFFSDEHGNPLDVATYQGIGQVLPAVSGGIRAQVVAYRDGVPGGEGKEIILPPLSKRPLP